MRMFIVVLALIGLLAGAGGWYWHSINKPRVEYKTAKVQRGELLASISATGTVEPEEVVDVGAQVAGLIVSFGKDADNKQVDYRSPVNAGTILAKIDDTTYKADVDTAQAQVDQAQANVQKANADKETADAKLFQAQRNWERAEKIGPSDALSQNDYDMYKADYETAKAAVDVAIAEIAQAKTGIAQGKAELDKATRNLEFCTITSPVKGVIIQRRVNVGQTVVSSLNAPSLFLIGKDLTRMQIWVSVNEADIDKIYPGQPVTFTCDGFDAPPMHGTVNKVRLYAIMTQNVVTYTVEVNFENPEGRLLPYRTANVKFEVQKDANVLLVPNSALRWYPSDADQVSPAARAQFKPLDSDEKPAVQSEMPAPKKEKRKGKKPDKPVERDGTIWLTDGEYVKPLDVKVGATDGINTEVKAADLKDGAEIVVGEVVQSEQEKAKNPFLPQIGHRGGGH